MSNWDLSVLCSVAIGGAVGACLRAFVYVSAAKLVGQREWLPFAHGTLVVNTIGSFLLGAAVVLANESGDSHRVALINVGFCGSLTTFSTFVNDAYLLCLERRWGALTLHVLLNTGLSLIAVALAMWIFDGY